jgi:hypothetical protein
MKEAERAEKRIYTAFPCYITRTLRKIRNENSSHVLHSRYARVTADRHVYFEVGIKPCYSGLGTRW